MSRLIDANKVVMAILSERDKIPRTFTAAPYELGTEKPYHAGNQMRGGIRKALRCIEQAPTVDAVPVVRCLECKNHSSSAFYHDLVLCTKHGIYMRTDGFCSFGDRKCNTTRKEGADNG